METCDRLLMLPEKDINSLPKRIVGRLTIAGIFVGTGLNQDLTATRPNRPASVSSQCADSWVVRSNINVALGCGQLQVEARKRRVRCRGRRRPDLKTAC